MRGGGFTRGPALVLTVLLTAWAGAQTQAPPKPTATQTQTYTNPVVTPVAADPSVIRAPDGTFYLYATQDDWADVQGVRYVPVFSSTDLVNWEVVGNAFAVPAVWKEGGGGYWAPDITKRGETYYLYYSFSTWGDPNPCIGLGTSAQPEGPFEDLGRAVFCSDDIGVENSIDPFIWEEGDTWTMIWGSFDGIYAVALSEDGTEPVGEPVQLADTRFEAPFVIRRNGYYYLFVSSGSCCDGEWSTYTLHVGRSRNLTGPYVDAQGRSLLEGGDRVVLERNETWVGPGHSSVVRDDAGVDWLVYHAIPQDDPRLPNGTNRRPALLDRITWQGGWPVVNGGQGPSSTPQSAPTIETP